VDEVSSLNDKPLEGDWAWLQKANALEANTQSDIEHYNTG
jgi:hypothetical protein